MVRSIAIFRLKPPQNPVCRHDARRRPDQRGLRGHRGTATLASRLTRLSPLVALYQPARGVCCALLGDHGHRRLIAGCCPMLCSNWGFRAGGGTGTPAAPPSCPTGGRGGSRTCHARRVTRGSTGSVSTPATAPAPGSSLLQTGGPTGDRPQRIRGQAVWTPQNIHPKKREAMAHAHHFGLG